MERMQGDAFVVVDRTKDVHADAEDILVFELGFPKQQYDPVGNILKGARHIKRGVDRKVLERKRLPHQVGDGNGAARVVDIDGNNVFIGLVDGQQAFFAA